MEEINKLNGQNISVSNCIININNTSNIDHNVSFEDFDFENEINTPHFDIYLLKNFLQNPEFINDMNFELFIDFLNSIPYDKSVNGAISLLEIFIHNINKFNPNLSNEILLKIISKLCYTNGVINGNEELYMSMIEETNIYSIINENTVFKSIILPLIKSNNIELTKKVINLIFKHSQREFCFLFLRTCCEFCDMIPQNFLYNMFEINERNELHDTIKKFIINNMQNIVILLTDNNNIEFILTYLNEIINENKDIILDTFSTGTLTYNITHKWSVSEHTINLEKIKNSELKSFIQNLINGIAKPIIIKPTIIVNQKLQEFLLNFNDMINYKSKFYNILKQNRTMSPYNYNCKINKIFNEIMISCEYNNNVEYILQKLLEINFAHRRFISQAINIFFAHYSRIKNIELKKNYIQLINQKNLDFDDILSFAENYEKFDDYLKSNIQEKFGNIAIEYFENFIQMPSIHKCELTIMYILLEKIHKNKIDEILLPIFIENAKYLDKKQQVFVKQFLLANVFGNQNRSIDIYFEMNNKEYQLHDIAKINKLVSIQCLDIFYNNLECFYESKEDTEAITIAILPFIINTIDKLECGIKEKLQLKTKIFLDMKKILLNPSIEIFTEKDEAMMFLLTRITEESIKHPEIILYFLNYTEENKIKNNEITFFDSYKPLVMKQKIIHKENNEIIFDTLLITNGKDKIKIQKSFMNCLEINLKQGNTDLLNLYCKSIKKFDEEFQQIILCKAFEFGIKDFDLSSSKTQQK